MAEQSKKLYRSRDNRWLGGVCGGIGEYFNLDPTLIRVLFILFAFFVGSGLLIYLILWIIIPTEPSSESGFPTAVSPEPSEDSPDSETGEGDSEAPAE